MLRAPAALLYVIDFLVGRRRQGRHADRPALELAAGYEVNVNFAPVIWYEGWLDDYRQLFDHLDAVLSPAARAQLAAEVIFMTHNEGLHKVNQRWHPRAEEWLWCPDFQEGKISGGGGRNVRYRLDFKRGLVADFRRLLNERLPYCAIRYAF